MCLKEKKGKLYKFSLLNLIPYAILSTFFIIYLKSDNFVINKLSIILLLVFFSISIINILFNKKYYNIVEILNLFLPCFIFINNDYITPGIILILLIILKAKRTKIINNKNLAYLLPSILLILVFLIKSKINITPEIFIKNLPLLFSLSIFIIFFIVDNLDNNKELKNIKRKEKILKEQATIDPLTGTLNRRAAFVILEKLCLKAKRNEKILSLCFLDMDNLKLVNDSFGHIEGDSLLISFSSILKDTLRESDYLCRFGGDEFLLIFSECNKIEAKEIIDRIKNSLFEYEKSKEYKIDFSYGIIEISHETTLDIHKLIEKADNKMYLNKQKKKKAWA